MHDIDQHEVGISVEPCNGFMPTGALIQHEIRTSMMTYFTARLDENSALMMVELGYGRTALTRVRNVPKEILDLLIQQGRILRPIILSGWQPETTSTGVTLKRVELGDVEYYITPVS